MFGGPAWTFDPERGQYYSHAYLREQPDLDWGNPAVGEAMLGILRFWLDRGVDGFRVDALRQVLKDPELRDNPPNPEFRERAPASTTRCCRSAAPTPRTSRRWSRWRRRSPRAAA